MPNWLKMSKQERKEYRIKRMESYQKGDLTLDEQQDIVKSKGTQSRKKPLRILKTRRPEKKRKNPADALFGL